LLSDFGERIRKAKRDWEEANDPHALSWAEVARRCERVLGRRVHAETVLLWKEGRQEPSVAEFRALAQVFHVTPSWLAFEQFPIKPAEDQPPIGPEPAGKMEVRSKRREK
jgi:transcriptional regulator with XRE-family HTH domain